MASSIARRSCRRAHRCPKFDIRVAPFVSRDRMGLGSPPYGRKETIEEKRRETCSENGHEEDGEGVAAPRDAGRAMDADEGERVAGARDQASALPRRARRTR